MTLVLGIDAGGTSTRAAIVDASGRLLGISTAAGGNLDDAGAAGVAAAIAAATRGARVEAGLGDDPFDAVFLGIAGVVSGADRAGVLAELQPLVLAAPERVAIDHDCQVALAGGLSGRPGIALVAGTGSAAFGIDPFGAGWRSGGWGGLVGDEGSSYSIAKDALRSVVRAADGRGPATGMQGPLLAALAAKAPEDLMRRLHLEGRGRAEIAALAPLVVHAATEGDRVAEGVLDDAAEQLAQMVDAVCRSLRFDAPVEVACVGGLFSAGEAITSRLARAVARRSPTARLVDPELEPVLGACLLALQSVGAADAAVVDRLRSVRREARPQTGVADAGA